MSTLKNFLNECGNDPVSEKSLKYLLPLIYPEIIKEISINQLGNYYKDIQTIDENLKLKRFDFVSISQKLIIEFDGEQHLKHIEHFGSYKQFIKLQSSDFTKHKFIKQNNFNLMRIAGKLTLQEFYNLIKNISFDVNNPKVIFIENNQINIINLNQLNDLPNDIDLLQTKILDLENQLKNKNEYISNIENQLKNEDEQILNLENKFNSINNLEVKNEIKEDQVYQFLQWADDKGFLIGQPPTNGLYQIYVNWNKDENQGGKLLKPKEFGQRVRLHAKQFGLKISEDQIYLSRISKLSFNIEVLNKYYFKNKINIDKYSKSRYIVCKERITDNKINEIQDKLQNNKLNFNDLSYKDLLVIHYLADNKDQSAINFIKILDKSLKNVK